MRTMRDSNDTLDLVPRTSFDGARELTFDFPALEIGIAEYEEGPTGCTVFHFPGGAAVAADVRGGSVGVLGQDFEEVDAICFSGGSLYGLEAAAGVSAELLARRGFDVAWGNAAAVAGAVIYDFRPRANAIYADKELGRAALRAARAGSFPLGARGAGRSATAGKLLLDEADWEPAGQGGAFRQLGTVRVAVFTVVNAMGALIDRAGTVVRGHVDRASGRRLTAAEGVERGLRAGGGADPGSPSTTLTLVATNLRLERRALRQLGRLVHASMARAIQPVHALRDGDVLFAVSTQEVDDAALGENDLGVIASELAWDAVLASFDA